MPNWSYNSLILEGSSSNLEKFYIENNSDEIRRGKKEELSFNKSIPRPDSEEENWYKWNCANWGTKWDACYITFKKEKKYYNDNITNTLLVMNRKLSRNIEPVVPVIQELFSYYIYTYNFDTAWSPPIPWLQKVSLLYKNIKFNLEYSIEGFDNGGNIIIKNGNILSSDEWLVSEKIFLENESDITKIIKDYINDNKEINKLMDDKESFNSELLEKCWSEGYYIGKDQIDEVISNLFKN